MSKPLDGIRVLEVAQWWFVPSAGALLSDWGADVIKVEHPEVGDPQRGLVTSGLLPAGGFNFMWEQPNRGKKSWCAERSSRQAIAELEEAKIPSGEVYTPQRALDDPHIREVGFMKDVDYPGLAKPAPVATTPVRFTATPGEIRRRAPTLGEHTDAILGELGYAADEIAALKEKRIV